MCLKDWVELKRRYSYGWKALKRGSEFGYIGYVTPWQEKEVEIGTVIKRPTWANSPDMYVYFFPTKKDVQLYLAMLCYRRCQIKDEHPAYAKVKLEGLQYTGTPDTSCGWPSNKPMFVAEKAIVLSISDMPMKSIKARAKWIKDNRCH